MHAVNNTTNNQREALPWRVESGNEDASSTQSPLGRSSASSTGTKVLSKQAAVSQFIEFYTL